MASQTPCTACSWTPERQDCCLYHSNVKIFHGFSDRGIWSIGSEVILKERGSTPPSYESKTMRFIKENTTIPVPTVIADWTEDNGRYFMIVKRAPGKPLDELWSTMADDEKNRIAKQAANYLRELRELQAPRMESLGGESLMDTYLFGSDFSASHGSMSSDDELWAEMEKSLSDVPEKARQRLREMMPTAAPYTFTHGELSSQNFMVKDGNITGILDWERSGYFPVWREDVGTLVAEDDEELEWKKLLRNHMPEHADAYEFFLTLFSFFRPSTSKSRERVRQFLEDSV